MMDSQHIGSTQVAVDDGRMVVIEVCRDDISGKPVTRLKVGTTYVEFACERASVTNFTVGIETPPVQLDEQALRDKLGSLVSTPESYPK